MGSRREPWVLALLAVAVVALAIRLVWAWADGSFLGVVFSAVTLPMVVLMGLAYWFHPDRNGPRSDDPPTKLPWSRKGWDGDPWAS